MVNKEYENETLLEWIRAATKVLGIKKEDILTDSLYEDSELSNYFLNEIYGNIELFSILLSPEEDFKNILNIFRIVYLKLKGKRDKYLYFQRIYNEMPHCVTCNAMIQLFSNIIKSGTVSDSCYTVVYDKINNGIARVEIYKEYIYNIFNDLKSGKSFTMEACVDAIIPNKIRILSNIIAKPDVFIKPENRYVGLISVCFIDKTSCLIKIVYRDNCIIDNDMLDELTESQYVRSEINKYLKEKYENIKEIN